MLTLSFNPAFAIFTMCSTSRIYLIENLFEKKLNSKYTQNHYYSFTDTQLFGLAPELSPVYHHILWKWRNYNSDKYKTQELKNLNGLNSGVILSYLERIRKSAEYDRLISSEWISSVVQKYLFKVSELLGDLVVFYLYCYNF